IALCKGLSPVPSSCSYCRLGRSCICRPRIIRQLPSMCSEIRRVLVSENFQRNSRIREKIATLSCVCRSVFKNLGLAFVLRNDRRGPRRNVFRGKSNQFKGERSWQRRQRHLKRPSGHSWRKANRRWKRSKLLPKEGRHKR